jgi:hypothetical protein
VPREVVFLDELPRNATGKVLKRELEEQDGQSDGADGGQAQDGAGQADTEEGSDSGRRAGARD